MTPRSDSQGSRAFSSFASGGGSIPSTPAVRHLVSLWFACSLLLAGLVMRVAAPVVGTTNTPVVNGAVAAGVALVAYASEPGLRSGLAWSLALVTFGGFVLAQAVVGGPAYRRSRPPAWRAAGSSRSRAQLRC